MPIFAARASGLLLGLFELGNQLLPLGLILLAEPFDEIPARGCLAIGKREPTFDSGFEF